MVTTACLLDHSRSRINALVGGIPWDRAERHVRGRHKHTVPCGIYEVTVRRRSHDSEITLLYGVWHRSTPCCSLWVLEGPLVEDVVVVPLGVVAVEGG